MNEIHFTFLYTDQGFKKILVEPNPLNLQQKQQTITNKLLFNMPATETMTNLLKVFTYKMQSESSRASLESALYFNHFDKSKQDACNDHKRKTFSCKEVSVTRFFLDLNKSSINNSNLDFELSGLMQEFATTNEVYFGWRDYYICSLVDFVDYVNRKDSRPTPVLIPFEKMCQDDLYLKDKNALYQSHRYYNSWLTWFPIGYAEREKKELASKQLIDQYYQRKVDEFNDAKKLHTAYETDLDRLLITIVEAAKNVPASAQNVSLLLKVKSK